LSHLVGLCRQLILVFLDALELFQDFLEALP
jgi:hypothetical protein